jgi:hypothetical protein
LTYVNISDDLGLSLANSLGCKLTKLPIIYLGIPLHYKKLIADHWNFFITKIENKLQSWKGKLLSIGGRVTLLNSVITSIPLYWMSIYRLPVHVRKAIDKLRKRFLWYGGNSVRKKYSLVAWHIVCKSKSQGGLGLLDLKMMNTTLLAKWIVRFQDPTVSSQ